MDRLQVYYNNITDTLIGPATALGSKYITHDASRNFISKEFQQYATAIAISIKAVLVKAH